MEICSASASIGFSISTSSKLEIGADKQTLSNDKNKITFDANERVVLRIKPANQNDTTTLGGGIRSTIRQKGYEIPARNGSKNVGQLLDIQKKMYIFAESNFILI